MDLVIDGYNLIGNNQGLYGAVEHKRNWLIQQLSQYQKIKKLNVIVVFDGWQSGMANESIDQKDGVKIVYSRLGEKADQVIIRIAREKGAGAVVVSSDREIRNAVERFGAVAIYSGEFNQILRSLDGSLSDDEDETDESIPSKAGNANRLSKSDRKRLDKLKKLKL
jgi:predicted RNA-binding protein with PIN domain